MKNCRSGFPDRQTARKPWRLAGPGSIKKFAFLLPLLILPACGVTPAGDALRAAIAERGAAFADEGLDNAIWFVCKAAPKGAIDRRFGHAPEIHVNFCGAAEKQVPPRPIGQ